MDDDREETTKPEDPQPIRSLLENISDLSDRVKQCACGFQMTEARWCLCRSISVFLVGVALSIKLQDVVRNVMNN